MLAYSAGRRRKPSKSSNLEILNSKVLLGSRVPLGSEKSHFSSDSSRKWQSLWSVAENLVWGLWASSVCWRAIGCVSGHHSLHKGTSPHCRITHLAKIKESATRLNRAWVAAAYCGRWLSDTFPRLCAKFEEQRCTFIEASSSWSMNSSIVHHVSE